MTNYIGNSPTKSPTNYIGNTPTGNFVKLDAITTSATTTFNLTNGGVAYYPQSANHCLVSLNGILQAPTDSFTISGSTIIFSSALTTSDVIDFIIVLGDVLNIGTPSDATVGFSKVTSNLITGATAETTIAGGDSLLIYDDSASALRKMTRTNFVAGLGSGFDTQLFHVRDEKSASTGGGSTVTGSFQKRTLNTTLTNQISGASISSSVITLPAGTYYINARVPFYGNTAHIKVKLRNTSDSTDTLLGSNSYQTSGVINDYWIIGRFTIASTKNFELQYQCGLAVSSEGLGHPSTYETEVYADCQIWKVA